MGEASGKTHWWKRSEDNVKPGDVIKYYDDLSLDERLALTDIRELGNARVLDEKASLLEDLAAAARHRANVRKRIEMHPWLDQEPPVVRPTYALAQVGLLSLALCLLVTLVVQMRARGAEQVTHPTLATQTFEKATPPTIEAAKAAPRSQKGGAGVAK